MRFSLQHMTGWFMDGTAAPVPSSADVRYSWPFVVGIRKTPRARWVVAHAQRTVFKLASGALRRAGAVHEDLQHGRLDNSRQSSAAFCAA